MNTPIAWARPFARNHRVDSHDAPAPSPAATSGPLIHTFLLAAIVSGFIAAGGGSLEPNDAEARLGLAAGESLAPLGQVYGGWDPTLSPGQVILSQLWAWLEGGIPTVGAIRWPSALAAIALGLLLARRMTETLSPRAGVFTALAVLGTFGMVDRSGVSGIDALAGLAIIASLDRILSRGSDWTAGAWAAASLILGGWPALATILLCAVLIGRHGSSLSARLLMPPIGVFLAWSAWAVMASRAEVWAAALTYPLTRPSAWSLGPWAVAAGLPWAPLAALLAWPSFRNSFDPRVRAMVVAWLQVAGVALLAGTLIPGLATACEVTLMVGLAVVAAAVLDRAWQGGLDAGPRRTITGLALVIGLTWAALAVYSGAWMAAAQPYYRIVAFVLLILGLASGLMALDSAWLGSTRGAVRVLILTAVGIKVAYAGVYIPEINYRFGKGPWGRAVGQYVPPRSTIYTIHDVSPALAFATEHPVRRIRSDVHLKGVPSNGPKFVLLKQSEFEHWSELAPKLLLVRKFQDEYGETRVLARTEGRLLRRDED